MTDRGASGRGFPSATWSMLFPGSAEPSSIYDALEAGLPTGWEAWRKPGGSATYPDAPFDDSVEALLTGRNGQRVRQRIARLEPTCPFYLARLFLIRAVLLASIEAEMRQENARLTDVIGAEIRAHRELMKRIEDFMLQVEEYNTLSPGGLLPAFFAQATVSEDLPNDDAVSEFRSFAEAELKLTREMSGLRDQLHRCSTALADQEKRLIATKDRLEPRMKVRGWDRIFVKSMGEFWWLLTGKNPASSEGPALEFIDSCYLSVAPRDRQQSTANRGVDLENQIRRLNDIDKSAAPWDGWRRLNTLGPSLASPKTALDYIRGVVLSASAHNGSAEYALFVSLMLAKHRRSEIAEVLHILSPGLDAERAVSGIHSKLRWKPLVRSAATQMATRRARARARASGRQAH